MIEVEFCIVSEPLRIQWWIQDIQLDLMINKLEIWDFISRGIHPSLFLLAAAEWERGCTDGEASSGASY